MDAAQSMRHPPLRNWSGTIEVGAVGGKLERLNH